MEVVSIELGGRLVTLNSACWTISKANQSNVINISEKLIVLSIYKSPCFEDIAKNRISFIDIIIAYLALLH